MESDLRVKWIRSQSVSREFRVGLAPVNWIVFCRQRTVHGGGRLTQTF
jgi:hypothetical protein